MWRWDKIDVWFKEHCQGLKDTRDYICMRDVYRVWITQCWTIRLIFFFPFFFCYFLFFYFFGWIDWSQCCFVGYGVDEIVASFLYIHIYIYLINMCLAMTHLKNFALYFDKFYIFITHKNFDWWTWKNVLTTLFIFLTLYNIFYTKQKVFFFLFYSHVHFIFFFFFNIQKFSISFILIWSL